MRAWVGLWEQNGIFGVGYQTQLCNREERSMWLLTVPVGIQNDEFDQSGAMDLAIHSR